MDGCSENREIASRLELEPKISENHAPLRAAPLRSSLGSPLDVRSANSLDRSCTCLSTNHHLIILLAAICLWALRSVWSHLVVHVVTQKATVFGCVSVEHVERQAAQPRPVSAA